MNYRNKNLLSKSLYSILLILLICSIFHFITFKSKSSQIEFENFMHLYTTRDIKSANNYIIDSSIPNINDIFYTSLTNSTDDLQTEIINNIEKLFYSINYNVISSKTLFNKSTLHVNFNYYDLSKHIINYFKTPNLTENTYEDFIQSLKETKYNLSTNIDIELVKKNKKWNIVLSEKLINILTSGLYKNFVI